MLTLVCPTCTRKFPSDQSDSLPFCCERCRLIDLGRWLGEQYSLPVDPESDVDETMVDEDDETY